MPGQQTTDNLQTVLDAGAALAAVRSATPGADPFVIIPAGYVREDLERTLPVPLRYRGHTGLNDAPSFIRFVNEFFGLQSKLYGTIDPPKFVAVFNANSKEGTGWADHSASYDCPLSIEWRKWSASNGKVMTQTDFAKFIEDNALDITDPASADMIDISRTIEAKKKVNFASGIRLADGSNELTFEEAIEGTAAKGRLKIPEVFTIAIPVLDGGDRYAVQARFRYRISDGKLALWFDLVRPHKVLEDAVKGVWKSIEDGVGTLIFNSAYHTRG